MRSINLKLIKDDRNWRRLIFPHVAAHGALCHLRQNVDLAALHIYGADFDGDILPCCLVDSKPYGGESAVAELVYYTIPFVKPIVNMNWIVAAKSVVTDIFNSLNNSVLDRWC